MKSDTFDSCMNVVVVALAIGLALFVVTVAVAVLSEAGWASRMRYKSCVNAGGEVVKIDPYRDSSFVCIKDGKII